MSIPSDHENKNGARAAWAALALRAFQRRTGINNDESIADLLCDLAHYCDRNNIDLRVELRRASNHYLEETDGEGRQLLLLSETRWTICGNCRGVYDEASLNPVQDLSDRIAPGEEVPAGECPECGCLCHLIK